MVLASLQVVIFGSVSFVLFWVLAVFPSFKALPLGRTAGAVAGAVLTVVLGVETPTEAYDAIDLSILGLLFGTMVVSVYMQQADMFKYLANLLSWRSRGSRDLLCRTCLLGAVSGALFTNDTCCLVLTSFILKLCHREKLPPLPFLVALATSANIGSAATPIGNPQNLVIAARSNISFSMFVAGMLPSVVVGIALNTVMLLLFYHKQLSPRDPDNSSSSSLGLGLDGSVGLSPRSVYAGNATKNATPWTPFQSSEELHIPHDLLHVARPSKREESHGSAPEVVLSLDTSSPLLTPKSDESLFHLFPQVLSPIDHDLGQTLLIPVTSASAEAAHRECKRIAWKCCVYFVACAMLVAFLLGYDLSWTSLTAAVCLMAIDFCDAGPNLDKVQYMVIHSFCWQSLLNKSFHWEPMKTQWSCTKRMFKGVYKYITNQI